MTVIARLAQTIDALKRCERSGNSDGVKLHKLTIRHIEDNFLPSGSGIDVGTKVDVEKSAAERVVLDTAYHHMNDGGCYDGWTEHTITITPSLAHGFNIRISGRDRNDIKDYLHDVFWTALGESCEPYARAAQREEAAG